MPTISNIPKKTPKKKITKKTNPKSPKSTHDYYCCCAEKTKSGLPQGTKITQLTSHCKNQAGSIAKVKQQTRETEKKKILEH
jgi:hypothetical protein